VGQQRVSDKRQQILRDSRSQFNVHAQGWGEQEYFQNAREKDNAGLKKGNSINTTGSCRHSSQKR